MIGTLQIKNIGIIEDLSINLNQGFNVLTGETGAGKSLIIEAIGIIAGGRFPKERIRKGEHYSFVEMDLYLPQHEKSIDGNIVISREIYENGRNSCKINGRLVTVTELKNFMSEIINIHGQRDNQNLLMTENHILYLDNFIGKDILEIKQQYQILYEKYKQINLELQKDYGDEKEKQRKLDLLKYQLKEIEEAELDPEEEIYLQEQKKLILNAEKISNNLQEIEKNLSEQAIDAINLSIRSLEKIEQFDENYRLKLNELKNIYYEVQEITRDITELGKNTIFYDSNKEEIEYKLDKIYSLKRKYGNSVAEILQYSKQVKEEIEQIENSEENYKELQKEEEEIKKQMNILASQMHKIRILYSSKLEDAINEELQELEMKQSKISIPVLKREEKFCYDGLDKVEFLITTNKGEETKPLTKIASGGEMSRIMLAIKTVLSDIDQIPILVFDEIDTGISGKAGKAVAQKMNIIAKKHQVICVTHLASIAAQADYHYQVVKRIENEKTKTYIKNLEKEEIIEEIARMANGEITEIAKQHARELCIKKVG